jgi:GNAT superfamily N-acetyltransferase
MQVPGRSIDSAPMVTLPATLTLREATADDLPAISALREAVGWAVHAWALRIVIEEPTARCVLAVEPDGTLAGVGSGITYGPLGWVGNMIVAETHRRRGVGSAVLEDITTWLAASGSTRLELYATPEGRPLYERHGFRSAGESAIGHVGRDTTLERDPSVTVRWADAADLPVLAAFDAPRFGGDRSAVVERFVRGPRSGVVIAERDGGLVGYAGLVPDAGRIGPFMADDPAVAETLVAEAFTHITGDELRLNLPPGNQAGIAWLRGLGVQTEPWDGRMFRGEPVPRRDETIYGIAVGALG